MDRQSGPYHSQNCNMNTWLVENSNNKPANNGFTSFGNLSVTACPHQSEIQEYLKLPVENVKDLLKWWVFNKEMYLNLHWMALDYLSIPATSTAIEPVFSQGHHLLPFTHNRLLPSSIWELLCFGSWSRCGLVLIDNVLEATSAKWKHDEVED